MNTYQMNGGGERLLTGDTEAETNVSTLSCQRDDPPSFASRQSRVINRDYVKRWALDYAKTNRAHPFSRVSEQFLNAIETSTKAAIRMRIDRAPSKGKTLQ